METRPVAHLLSRFWWMILLRGVFAVLFGIMAFAWPSLTLVSLTLLFAAYVFADGVFEVAHAIGHRQEIENWGLLLLEGVFGILFGIIAFQAPELTTAVGTIIVAFYIATWSIVTGVMRISMAIRLRKEIEGEWLLGFSGAVSILLGLVVLVRPQVGALGLLYVVAAAAIILGMTLVAFAIKVRMFAVRIRQTVQSIREQ
ncbi:MAG: HdeD family acid-resistance protein [Planctomycetaceae bacterium]